MISAVETRLVTNKVEKDKLYIIEYRKVEVYVIYTCKQTSKEHEISYLLILLKENKLLLRY